MLAPVHLEESSYGADKLSRSFCQRSRQCYHVTGSVIIGLQLVLILFICVKAAPVVSVIYGSSSQRLRPSLAEQNSSWTEMMQVDAEGAVLHTMPHTPVSSLQFPRGPRNERQERIVDMMRHAWNDGYVRYCWGEDELLPVSRRGYNGWRLGLTLVDSLDTLHIMGLQAEFDKARDWIADSSNFNLDKVGNVNLFETTIRVLGGLLGAYALSADKVFLDRAQELGDRLLPAVQSPHGIPYTDIEVRSGSCKFGAGDASTAEGTTIQLEFKTLSRMTGDQKYAKAVEGVSDLFRTLPKLDGLVPILVNPRSHEWIKSAPYSLGARGDSYYEYLLKQWVLSNRTEPVFLADYQAAMAGVRQHLVKQTAGPLNLTYIAERRSDGNMSPKMDHLVCFLPGLLALGVYFGAGASDDLALAREILRTCNAMYEATGHKLGPEITHFDMNGQEVFIKKADSHDILRPETVESLFYLFRFTGNKVYQDWGWEIAIAIDKYARVSTGGYTSLRDTLSDPPTKDDKMESFFLGETLKYLFLLFDDERDQLPLNAFVLNTEAHPMPIYTPA